MNDISLREPPIVNTIIIAVDTGERDRLFANTVRSMLSAGCQAFTQQPLLATSPKAAPGLGPALAWLDTVDCALSDRCSAAPLRRAVAEVGVAPQDDVKAAQHRDVADVGPAHRRTDPESDLVVFAVNAHGVP